MKKQGIAIEIEIAEPFLAILKLKLVLCLGKVRIITILCQTLYSKYLNNIEIEPLILQKIQY